MYIRACQKSKNNLSNLDPDQWSYMCCWLAPGTFLNTSPAPFRFKIFGHSWAFSFISVRQRLSMLFKLSSRWHQVAIGTRQCRASLIHELLLNYVWLLKTQHACDNVFLIEIYRAASRKRREMGKKIKRRDLRKPNDRALHHGFRNGWKPVDNPC